MWRPPSGGSIDFSEPMGYLADRCHEWKVAQVCYDPYQLHDSMIRFQRENKVWCEPFQQAADRNVADSDLFSLIRNHRLTHNGDADLREHIRACGLKMAVREDSKGRLVKRGSGKIDAAVSLSMAASRCLYLRLDGVNSGVLAFPEPDPISIHVL